MPSSGSCRSLPRRPSVPEGVIGETLEKTVSLYGPLRHSRNFFHDKDPVMYELLIKAYIEYFQAYPSERERLQFISIDSTAEPRTVMPEDVGARWLAWLQTDAAWTPASITRPLQQEMERLQHAPLDEQRQFETALRHALAQLAFGEHQ